MALSFLYCYDLYIELICGEDAPSPQGAVWNILSIVPLSDSGRGICAFANVQPSALPWGRSII